MSNEGKGSYSESCSKTEFRTCMKRFTARHVNSVLFLHWCEKNACPTDVAKKTISTAIGVLEQNVLSTAASPRLNNQHLARENAFIPPYLDRKMPSHLYYVKSSTHF